MAWYNSSWTYRKSIVIDQTDDLGADAAYQMKLLVGKSSSATGEQVDCADHCEADFDDLRFTKSDGTTLLDYWIESISGSGSSALATVWIETILLDDAADTTIYMYYGNVSASAASNGTNTWIIFDHFDDSSLNTSIWDSTTSSGSISESGTNLTVNGGSSASGGQNGVRSKASFLYGRLRFLATLKAASGSWSWIANGATQAIIESLHPMDAGNDQGFWCSGDGVQYNRISDGTTATNGSTVAFTGSSYIHEMRWSSSTFCKFYKNDELLSSFTSNCPNTAIYINFTAGNNAGASAAVIDWVVLGQITANEPTWKSFGSEEIAAKGYSFGVIII